MYASDFPRHQRDASDYKDNQTHTAKRGPCRWWWGIYSFLGNIKKRRKIKNLSRQQPAAIIIIIKTIKSFHLFLPKWIQGENLASMGYYRNETTWSLLSTASTCGRFQCVDCLFGISFTFAHHHDFDPVANTSYIFIEMKYSFTLISPRKTRRRSWCGYAISYIAAGGWAKMFCCCCFPSYFYKNLLLILSSFPWKNDW